MRIYVDESGNFMPEAAPTRVCCEAALVVPERCADELRERFVTLRRTWTAEPELKGSSLSDNQTAAALRLLSEYDVLVEIGSLDVGHNSKKQIGAFRQGQADAILAGLAPTHNENVLALRSSVVPDDVQRFLRLTLPPQTVFFISVLLFLS
jgi:hypothetical protein